MQDRTVNSIIEWFTEAVTNKQPITPGQWVEAGSDLNVLRSDEDDKLFELQQKVAETKVQFIKDGLSVAMAKAYTEATDDHKEMCRQRAKLARIEEFIRLAKIHARLTMEEIKGN